MSVDTGSGGHMEVGFGLIVGWSLASTEQTRTSGNRSVSDVFAFMFGREEIDRARRKEDSEERKDQHLARLR